MEVKVVLRVKVASKAKGVVVCLEAKAALEISLAWVNLM